MVTTSLPPGLTIWMTASSDWVTRKRIRMRSKRQSLFGVKARLFGVPKVTLSMTSGSRFSRCDQAKAATVKRTRRAKTTAPALVRLTVGCPKTAHSAGRRRAVLADHHRHGGAFAELGDFFGHRLHPRDLERL